MSNKLLLWKTEFQHQKQHFKRRNEAKSLITDDQQSSHKRIRRKVIDLNLQVGIGCNKRMYL